MDRFQFLKNTSYQKQNENCTSEHLEQSKFKGFAMMILQWKQGYISETKNKEINLMFQKAI